MGTRDLGREKNIRYSKPLSLPFKIPVFPKKSRKQKQPPQKYNEPSALQWNASKIRHLPQNNNNEATKSQEISYCLKQEEKAEKLLRSVYTAKTNVHMYINYERTKRDLPPLKRRCSLDKIAKEQAMAMAKKGKVFHSEPGMIQQKLNRPSRRIGENVKRGCNCDIR